MTDFPFVICIGAGVARRIVQSTFAADIDNNRAMTMHARIAEPERTYRQGWADMVAVSAPPASWETLAAWAASKARRLRAGDTVAATNEARAMARLSRQINHELDRLAGHPAYHGQAVAGVDPLVLPAFKIGDTLAPTPGRARNAHPTDGTITVGVMEPYTTTVRNRTMTCWIFDQRPNRPDLAAANTDPPAVGAFP